MSTFLSISRGLGLFVIIALSIGHVKADETWSDQKMLNIEQMIGEAYDRAPRIASDTSGNVMALWHITETNFARLAVAYSPTKGTSYGGESYIEFGDSPGLNGNIAYAGNGIWVCVASINDGDYYKGVFSRSFDNGRTWTAPSPLAQVITYPGISLASDKAGTLIASAGSALIRSTDFGETWVETPAIVPWEGDYWTSPVGVIRSLVNTDGSGNWVHAYLSFEARKTIFSYHALVSTDNGSTWNNVLEGNTFESYQPTLDDVAISGNDIVIAASINNKNGLYVSRTKGESWSDFTQFTENCRGIVVAAQGTRWNILASPFSGGGPWNFMSDDLVNWRFTTLRAQPFIGDECALTSVVGEGFAALMRVGKDIAGMTYQLSAPPVPAPDLAISFKQEPKVKVIDKQNRDTKRIVTAKISVSNLGELQSERTLVKCWLTDWQNSPGFTEPKYVTVKPLKAAKPGKKPKTRTIKVRFVESKSPSYIRTQVMQSFDELNPSNNFVEERI